MDHRMPLKNGLEATKEITKLDNRTRVIFASADNSIKQLALQAGAISFQAKPFKMTDLINEIKRNLR
jgi:DNA-binding NtrC family response regulator